MLDYKTPLYLYHFKILILFYEQNIGYTFKIETELQSNALYDVLRNIFLPSER